MEQSSLGSTTSESENSNGSVREPKADMDKSADPQVMADQLLAALASGNLDHLAQAREAFLKQSSDSPKAAAEPKVSSHASAPQRSADLEASLERPAKPRNVEHQFAAVDQLRQEEDELRRVEVELDR